jgi:hypothetical protein
MPTIHSQPDKQATSSQPRQRRSEPTLSYQEVRQATRGTMSSPRLPSTLIGSESQQVLPIITPSDVVALQRTIGNQAVARMLQKSNADDRPLHQSTLQRATLVRPQSGRPELASGVAGGQLSPSIQNDIQAAHRGGHALDRKVGLQMGQAFGKDFGGVKIHTDAKADLISRSLNASAFTLGQDIFFGKNQYRPTTTGGQKLLAHELTHVVQQTGASGPTVQTKLAVGAVDNHYEQEAERVAQQVTQRLTTQPQFNRAPGQSPQVQRQTESTPPVQVRLKTAHHATIARSYRDSAAAFEQSLGVYAFHHPKANIAAKAMSDRVRNYIEQKAQEDGETEDKIDKLWQKAGAPSETIAGAVGGKINAIKKVFAKGNLRERMTHVHNFMDHHFGNTKVDNRGELSKIAVNQKVLNQQFGELSEITGEQDELYYGDVLHKAAPYSTALSQQRSIRQPSGEDSRTKLTVKEVGFDKEGGLLSKREARLMFGEFDNKDSLKDKQLTWSEGARVWKMQKSHEWVQTMERLDMPLMAGPSAHTNAFLNIAKLFGIKDLASVRLAVIGQLLPINAHSLVEIMTAASGHGLPFTPGPEMYRSIPPLKTKELRDQVGKGSFPDAFGSEATGRGGDYRKLLKKFRDVFKLLALPPDEIDPQRQLTTLTDLDQAALAHIAVKQREKDKVKNNPTEITRLEGRIQAVEEMREQIRPKITQAKSAVKLNYSHKRIQELSQNKEYNNKLFHGTHTGLLEGLTKSQGTLISAKELENRGITRSSGEGDFFSNGVVRGPKEFISIGVGEFGLGTALAYAQAAGTLPNYNLHVYKDEELATETLRLKEAIDHYDESLIDLDKGEREFKSKAQLQNLYDRLQGEIEARGKLPKDHPRRRGELSNDSNFPLLFEFENQGLDVRDDGGYASREQGSMEAKTYNTELMGERMVYGGTIDLKPRIRRVYCPVDKIDEVSQKLTTIMGHSNFEVLAIEALQEMPTNTPIGGVRHETYAMQLDFEDVRKNVISGYAQGMKTKHKVSNIRKLAKEYTSLPPTKDNKDPEGVGKQEPKQELTVSPSKVEPQQDTKATKEGNSVVAQTPLEKALSNDGLRIHAIDGNGNCLFASIIHQLSLQGATYKTPMELRRALAKHMLAMPVHYQQTVLAPIFAAEGLSVAQAALRIQTPGYWSGLVGDTAPQLLANLLARPLLLYRPDGTKQTINPIGASTGSLLSLVYNGSTHYDSTAPSGVSGPVVSKIPDVSGDVLPTNVEPTVQVLDKQEKQVESHPPKLEELTTEKLTTEKMMPSPTKESNEGNSKTTDKTDAKPQPAQNILSEDSAPVPVPKKGKPRVVLSGHGLLKEETLPTKTKVPSKIDISFTGPMGSILDNPLANAVEENRLRPEDIFVEAANMETGEVTEIEPQEIIKLYKIFGPRTIKSGKMSPNYTLTPPKNLTVSVNNQVFTVDRNRTLAEIFPILRKLYPKGVSVEWAACQDLPAIDRQFQLKVMNVSDRFVSTANVKRPTTSGTARKAEIKKIEKMIKAFKTL